MCLRLGQFCAGLKTKWLSLGNVTVESSKALAAA